MSYPRPFSREHPCSTCGAGMGHSPDQHEPWCAEQAKFNSFYGGRSWPDWYEAKLKEMIPHGGEAGPSNPHGFNGNRRLG